MSTLVDMHERAGVQWARGDGPRLARNYGDPRAEYEAARDAAVVIDRADRGMIRVYGRDPVRMIQGLVSNDVASADTARAVYAAVLSPKGKMIADVRVLKQPDGDLLLELSRDALPGMMAHLKKFLPPVFARFEDYSSAVRVLGVYGPAAAKLAGVAIGMDLPEDAAEDRLVGGGEGAAVVAVRSDYAGPGGWDLFVEDASAPGLWERLVASGARPAGQATLEVLRIEEGSPKWGAELTEDVIPLEAGLRDRAISQSKGCYTGQEVIIRILHRGHVNWLLRGFLLGEVPVPATGTTLARAGEAKAVARITSACESPRFGQTIALGYARREVEPPAALAGVEDGVAAQAVTLPFAGAELTDG